MLGSSIGDSAGRCHRSAAPFSVSGQRAHKALDSAFSLFFRGSTVVQTPNSHATSNAWVCVVPPEKMRRQLSDVMLRSESEADRQRTLHAKARTRLLRIHFG